MSSTISRRMMKAQMVMFLFLGMHMLSSAELMEDETVLERDIVASDDDLRNKGENDCKTVARTLGIPYNAMLNIPQQSALRFRDIPMEIPDHPNRRLTEAYVEFHASNTHSGPAFSTLRYNTNCSIEYTGCPFPSSQQWSDKVVLWDMPETSKGDIVKTADIKELLEDSYQSSCWIDTKRFELIIAPFNYTVPDPFYTRRFYTFDFDPNMAPKLVARFSEMQPASLIPTYSSSPDASSFLITSPITDATSTPSPSEIIVASSPTASDVSPPSITSAIPYASSTTSTSQIPAASSTLVPEVNPQSITSPIFDASSITGTSQIPSASLIPASGVNRQSITSPIPNTSSISITSQITAASSTPAIDATFPTISSPIKEKSYISISSRITAVSSTLASDSSYTSTMSESTSTAGTLNPALLTTQSMPQSSTSSVSPTPVRSVSCSTNIYLKGYLIVNHTSAVSTVTSPMQCCNKCSEMRDICKSFSIGKLPPSGSIPAFTCQMNNITKEESDRRHCFTKDDTFTHYNVFQ